MARTILCEKLTESVELFLANGTEGSQEVPGNVIFSVCLTVENILKHCLQNVAFIGSTQIWDFVEKLDESLPGSAPYLKFIRETSKNDLGRGRIFIRYGLLRHSLGKVSLIRR